MKSMFPSAGLAILAGTNLILRSKPGAGGRRSMRFRSAASRFLIICAGLICTSHVLAQGENNPTGAAGSFSGSIATGGGSFDPFERNASRSVTDIVVPGAVVPFTYTRIWNSRNGAWRNNWDWRIQANISHDDSLSGNPNDNFSGYLVYYPDGRVVQFDKPTTPAHAPPGTPGTYTNAYGVLDRFVIDADRTHGHLFLSDGSVLNFDVAFSTTGSLIDPHGRVVTFSSDATGRKITEPGGRWIYMSSWQLSGNTNTRAISTSLGQSTTESYTVNVSGSNPAPPVPGPDTGYYSAAIGTALGAVTYNDVADPATGQPLQAQSVYKNVQPPNNPNFPNNPPPPAFNRLIWASDPMFDGPLQQIKYLYVDNDTGTTMSNGDPSRMCVRGENWAANADDVGVMVSRVEMPANVTWSYDAGGYSPNYSDRIETHGDGAVRTISYFNPTTHVTWYDSHNVFHTGFGQGQMFADHITDFTNNPSVTERHEYDMAHLFQTPTKITDARGNVTLQTLESVLGHITKETHPDTNYQSWTYTDPAHPYYVATTTDELLRTATYTRDPTSHLVTRIDYPGGMSETFTYNSFGQVYDHQLANGTMEHFRYDARGLKTSEWNDAYPTEVTYYTYDAKDRVATVRNPRAVALGIPYSLKYEYNGRHQVTKIHYPATGGSSDPTVTYSYDKWGRCTSITDELGNTRTMLYDDYGRIISYTEPLNALGWDGTGNVATRTWTWSYERVRNGVTYAANTHVAKEWRTQIEPAFDKDGNRRMTVREYDVNNRLATEQTGWIVRPDNSTYFGPDGETHSFTYDAEGNKASYTDPRNRLTTYAYDSRNRLTQTTEPLSRITTAIYDAASNKTKVTFPDSTTQQWLDFNGFGQPGRFIDERNNTTNLAYQWGPMKKLASVTTHRDKDAGGTEDQLTTFSYDGTGRPTRTLFPDGHDEVTTYQYDQISNWKTRSNQTKSISYDARGREISHTWSDGVTPGISRTWDDANRLTVIWNTYSIIDYGYDGAGQVLYEGDNVSGSGGRTQTNYFRYPNGDMSYVHYPGGPLIRHEYTARGQLSGVSWDDIDEGWTYQRYLGNYYYLADGKVDHLDYGNGVRTAFSYDGRGFTNAVNTTKSGAILSNRTYYRDNRDRIYAWAKSNTQANNQLENGRGDRYTYDAEGQLIAASYEALTPNTTPTGAQRTESFTYDQLGNRKGVNQIASLGSVTMHRRDSGVNEYLDWTHAGINYENNGNLYQDGWMSASYNALNQPISIWSSRVNPSGNSVSFGYDPLGRCVKRWTASSDPYYNPATYFVYDGWNLLQEGASPWYPARVYVHGGRVDEILYSVNTQIGASAFHQYDARGHCTLLTGNSGTITEQYQYDAFGYPYFFDASGNALPNGSTYGNRFLFTGREWIKEIAVYDFRNRHYLPELGRFIQPDPLGFGGEATKFLRPEVALSKTAMALDYNLYRYCHNDPINKADPIGLFLWPNEKPVTVQGGTPNEQARMEKIVANILKTPRGQTLEKQIRGPWYRHGDPKVINLNSNAKNNADTPGRNINIDPNSHPSIKTTAGIQPASTERITAHELGHAVTGVMDSGPGRLDNVKLNENPITTSLGESYQRIAY